MRGCAAGQFAGWRPPLQSGHRHGRARVETPRRIASALATTGAEGQRCAAGKPRSTRRRPPRCDRRRGVPRGSNGAFKILGAGPDMPTRRPGATPGRAACARRVPCARPRPCVADHSSRPRLGRAGSSRWPPPEACSVRVSLPAERIERRNRFLASPLRPSSSRLLLVRVAGHGWRFDDRSACQVHGLTF
jgi:hypothetical protein